EVYTVRHDNEGNTFVISGDGIKGARLPTGQENIKAKYRKGIGPDGEVGVDRLKLLQSKPLGIREVTNPLAATGAAAQESLTEARSNAPLTVLTLDRIVSIKDFQDFAAAFSGVGKAQATALWNGEAFFAHITIATASGEPVPATSDLYRNLVAALDLARDTTVFARVDTYVPHHFDVKAQIVFDSRYLRENVEAEIKSALQSTFSFEKRVFGQSVTKAEVITAVQDVEDVVAVKITGLDFHSDGVPTQVVDPLPAQRARWEDNDALLAELLLINPGPEGVTLEEMAS
ncbi:MAG: baseplate J/gp47 family protein, partial [Planctomycetota bacterium]